MIVWKHLKEIETGVHGRAYFRTVMCTVMCHFAKLNFFHEHTHTHSAPVALSVCLALFLSSTHSESFGRQDIDRHCMKKKSHHCVKKHFIFISYGMVNDFVSLSIHTYKVPVARQIRRCMRCQVEITQLMNY